MTRMTGPDCVVMCNLINTHTHMSELDKKGSATYYDVLRVVLNMIFFVSFCDTMCVT